MRCTIASLGGEVKTFSLRVTRRAEKSLGASRNGVSLKSNVCCVTVPGYAVSGRLGVGAPNGTPADIISKPNQEIAAGLADPKLKTRLNGTRWRANTNVAFRLRKIRRRRNRKVDQGGEVRGRQAGRMRRSSEHSISPRSAICVRPMSALGHNPTFGKVRTISALSPKADIRLKFQRFFQEPWIASHPCTHDKFISFCDS